MSGRYTFVAGTDATASQMNNYVMDGIPFKIVAGTATVTGSLAVTFASAFTTGVTPIISTGYQTNTASTGGYLTFGVPTNTGVTLYSWLPAGTASTTGKVCHFTAIQMTSTTGAGNS